MHNDFHNGLLLDNLVKRAQERDQYRKIHILAKLITCLIINGLNITIGVMTGLSAAVILLISLQITIWFFGVNFIAYMIEKFAKCEHRHEVI